MNNRFFLGAVAALSIVSANAERLLDSADNCLVVDNEPMVFGSMVNNKAWTTAEQRTASLGLYRFFGYTVDTKPVVLSTDFQIESAAYKNGTYYIESTANADTDADVKLHGHLIAYEPDLDIMSEIAPITNIHNLAGSITYNPADNKMYCFFANEWTESYTEFGTFDETTATSTFIRSYYNDIITMAALAFDRNGQGYALNVKGELYRLDAATGALTKIGFTGVTPRYSQSMAFDYRNDKLYWFGSSVDNTMRLYEIDTATAKATAVSDNSQAQFLGIYFENPVNAAPDCVTDLAYTSTGARREGTLSFRMPEKTFGGAALEGTLNVRIAIEGVDTVTMSGKNPGELVSLPLTLPDGTARIVVTADNAKGYGLQSRVKTQVGVDQPMPAENVSLRVDGGEATLSWTAPTAGKNGGYVGNLTYRVERNDGVVVAEATTETSLTGLQKGKYSLTEYKVTAANESGAASAATSNSVILGDALAMPFKESFDGGTCQHTWFMGAVWDTFTAGNDPKTQDADGTGGLISFCCYSTNVAKGTVSTIVSPAIAVGGQQAYFNFSVYHYSGTFATEDSLTPCAIAADGSVQTLGDPIMRDNGTTGWKEYSYPISGNVVCVALKGYSDYGYNIHVDRIAVSTEQSGVSAVEIADNALVTVYNLSGARVAERMQRSDVSTLAPGCYIVRSATATEKVIVR